MKLKTLKDLEHMEDLKHSDSKIVWSATLKHEAIKWIKERQIPYGDIAEFFNLTAGLMTEDYWEKTEKELKEKYEKFGNKLDYGMLLQIIKDKAAHEKALAEERAEHDFIRDKLEADLIIRNEKAMQAIKDKIHIIEQCQEFTSCTFPCKNKSCKNRKYCILAGGSIKRLFAASNTKPKEDEKVKYINGRKFYKNRTDAEHERRKGDRIYIEPTHGWYIIRPQKRGLWN